MEKLQILFSLFKENRPVFQEKPQDLPSAKIDTGKIDNEAEKETAKFFEQFGKFKTNPEEIINQDVVIDIANQENEKGFAPNLRKVRTGIETQIGAKLFPENTDLAKKASIQMNDNYIDTVVNDKKANDIVNKSKAEKIKFEKPTKNGDEIVFKTTFLGENDKILHQIEVKFTKENLEEIEAERERVKAEAKEKRVKEQEEFMMELGSDTTLGKINTELGSETAKQIEFRRKTIDEKYLVFDVIKTDGNTELGIVLKINKSDTTKFIIEETGAGEAKPGTTTEEISAITPEIKTLFANKLQTTVTEADTNQKAKKAQEVESKPSKEAGKTPIETIKEKRIEPEEETLLKVAGIEIRTESGRKKVYFDVNGVERSFILTKDFEKKLSNPENTPVTIRLMCYTKLLQIVDRGGKNKGINIVKHGVAGGIQEEFEKSNQEMREYVKTHTSTEELEETTEELQNKSNQEKVGKFNGIEIYVNARGEIVSRNGKVIQNKDFRIKNPTTVEDIKKTQEYTKALQDLTQRQKAVVSGYESIGNDKEGNLVYVDGGTSFYNTNGEVITPTNLTQETSTIETARTKARQTELRNAGIEITQPETFETINTDDILKIKEFKTNVEKIIKEGKNFYEVLNNLNRLSEEIEEKLEKSTITVLKLGKITKNTSALSLTWKRGETFITENDSEIIKDIKAEQYEGGKNSREYIDFLASTSGEIINLQEEEQNEDRSARYLEKYNKLTKGLTYLDRSMTRFNREKIQSNFDYLDGPTAELRQYLTQPPFGYSQDDVPRLVADITINEWVSFDEIFKMIPKSGIIKQSEANPDGIPEKALKSSTAFMREFEQLMRKDRAKTITSEEGARLLYMFNSIITPCLQVKEAVLALRFDKKALAAMEKEKKLDLSKDQKEILSVLGQFCGFETRDPSGWENFLSKFMPGNKTEMTMADINGRNFTLDKGMFSRNFNSDSAINILSNRPGLYKIDENRNKILLKDGVIKELNRIIERGILQLIILEKSGEKGLQAPLGPKFKESEEFKKRLKEVQITEENFSKGEFTIAQFEAFQFGFLLDQETRIDKQNEEGIDALAEGNIARKQILEQLLNAGVPFETVKATQQKLALMAGFLVDSSGNFVGAGLGTSIDLGNGFSLGLGLGVDKTGNVAGGAALTFTIYQNDKVVVTTSLGISTAGMGADIATKISTEKEIDVKLFAGVGFTWTNPVMIGGRIGIALEWNAEKAFQRKLETEEKEIFNPNLTATLDQLVSDGSITQKDREHIEARLKDSVKSEVLNDLKAPFITGGGVQLVMIGGLPVPILSISFNIGSVTITTPNRRKMAEYRESLSDARAKARIDAALKKLEDPNAETEYHEGMDNFVYSGDGQLMILDAKQEVEFNGLGLTSSLDDYNKILSGANDPEHTSDTDLRLVQRGQIGNRQRIELQINNTEKKDVHLNIDPALNLETEDSLLGVKVVQDSTNGSIYIIGNIDDLIITRERFTLPFPKTKGGASIRDYITIKQRSSVRAERTNRWIETHSPTELVKFMGMARFVEKSGIEIGNIKGNIMQVAGFSTKDLKDLTPEDRAEIERYLARQPDMTERLTEEDLSKKEELVIKRKEQQSAPERGRRISVEDYNKVDVKNPEFIANVNKLANTKDFKTEVGKLMGRGEDLVNLLIKNKDLLTKLGLGQILEKGNEKLLTSVVMTLENNWFTEFYESGKTNKQLLTRLKTRAEWVKKTVFLPKFKEAMERLVPPLPAQYSPERLCENFFNKMFSKLEAKLNNPKFDFRTLIGTNIPDGVEFFSGSRRYEGDKRIGTMAENISYTTGLQDAALIHSFGFLSDTISEYRLNAGSGVDKATARVLMEIADPAPKENDTAKEFLDSKFTRRILNMDALVLIMSNTDYQKITEIMADESKLGLYSYQKAFEKFKDIVTELREAMINGSTFERRISGTQAKLKMNFETSITSGAYTKCANPSFYLSTKGTLGIVRDGETRPVATLVVTDDMINPIKSKEFISIGLAGGVAISAGTAPEGGKHLENSPASEHPATDGATKADVTPSADTATPTTDTGASSGFNATANDARN